MCKFLPHAEALAVAQSLQLASRTEWVAWCKNGMRPPNVPSNPNRTYKHDGWQGWGHWLGTGNPDSAASSSAPQPPRKRAAAGDCADVPAKAARRKFDRAGRAYMDPAPSK